MDSDCGPLELEVTALPTEPQPLPKNIPCLNYFFKRAEAGFFFVYFCPFVNTMTNAGSTNFGYIWK